MQCERSRHRVAADRRSLEACTRPPVPSPSSMFGRFGRHFTSPDGQTSVHFSTGGDGHRSRGHEFGRFGRPFLSSYRRRSARLLLLVRLLTPFQRSAGTCRCGGQEFCACRVLLEQPPKWLDADHGWGAETKGSPFWQAAKKLSVRSAAISVAIIRSNKAVVLRILMFCSWANFR